MRDYAARLLDDFGSFATNTVRLAVRTPDNSYLMADGTWITVPEGQALDAEPGIVLPRDAIEAIAVAIQEWQGHTSHADTEARVLREWLAVERDRTDRTLAARLSEAQTDGR